MISLVTRIGNDLRTIVQIGAAIIGLLADIRYLMMIAVGATEAQPGIQPVRGVPDGADALLRAHR